MLSLQYIQVKSMCVAWGKSQGSFFSYMDIQLF